MKKDSIFFSNLNGLRFLGALMVFTFHCFTLNREIWGDFYNNSFFQFITKIASKGHHGVGLFFVLSGFLITFLLLTEVKDKGKIVVRNFFMRRILRIWPIYFLLLVFGFFIFPNLPYGHETKHSIVYFSSFLSNIDEIKIGLFDNLNFLTVTWSVSIEEQFYLFWMLLLLLIPVFRKGYYFQYYFALIVIGSVVFRFFNNMDERTLYFHTFSVMSDLAIGGLLAWLVQKKGIQKHIMKLKKIHLVLIYLIGIGIIFTSNQIFVGPLIAIERICIGVFFAFVILEQVYSEHSFFKMDRIPYFFASGEMTYGFYMFHCVFIYYWSIYFSNHAFTQHVWQFALYFLVVFISTYATAWLSLHFVERPILSLKKYFR